jgi:hypothetical protein
MAVGNHDFGSSNMVLFACCAVVLSPAAFSFDSFFSDTAVREAYFVGQRRDERTMELLEKYRRRFAPPKLGPRWR